MNVLLLVLTAMSGSTTCCFGYSNIDRSISRRRCHGGFTNINNSNDDDGINERYNIRSPKKTTRREVFNIALQRTLVTTTATTIITSSLVPPKTARALDYDAFESSIITKDSSKLQPKLNDDEALCKYGAPGKAMGEACSRANIQRTLPGGVDVTGKVDRGEYLKCRYEYPIDKDTGEYVKTRVCRPSSETTYD